MRYASTPAGVGRIVVIILAWHRFGPYHHARARAASVRLNIVGLEMSTIDSVNAWAPVEAAEGFEKVTVCTGEAIDSLSGKQLITRVDAVLGNLDPSVVVVHGYANRDALAIMRWALAHKRPVVVMSASNIFDTSRSKWREWLKRRLLRLCSAGLAGGTHGRQYLESLGLPATRVFMGYDVVDNFHFSAGAVEVTPASVNMSGPFFLASARFVGKKNLFRLLDAYAIYKEKASSDGTWRLVLLGDGALRHEIEQRRASLGLISCVSLPGYKQYNELSKWYGAASSFIHPSTSEQWGLVVNEAMAAGLPILVSDRCGCATDLVREGVNGFIFDPYDIQGMADLMFRVAHGDVDREAMGRASADIIASWGPERFADGLASAVHAALAAPAPKSSWFDKALLTALIHR